MLEADQDRVGRVEALGLDETLFLRRGRPEQAERLVDEFARAVEAEGVEVAEGRFGAMMQVDLRNNGPFTLMVETVDGRVV